MSRDQVASQERELIAKLPDLLNDRMNRDRYGHSRKLQYSIQRRCQRSFRGVHDNFNGFVGVTHAAWAAAFWVNVAFGETDGWCRRYLLRGDELHDAGLNGNHWFSELAKAIEARDAERVRLEATKPFLVGRWPEDRI